MTSILTKPKVQLYGSFAAAILGVIFHFLIINRKLWFLKNDTVYSGGKDVPTEKIVEMLTQPPYLLYAAPLFVAVGIINYRFLKKYPPQ